MNNKIPDVSIVIPTYNREFMIIKALQSIFEQTYQNYEVIIIDDGSTDNTKQVIKDFVNDKKYFKEKLKYMKFEKNGGIPRALNKGYELSLGKYLCQLSSDDIWLPNKLEKQVKIFEEDINKNIGLIYSDYIFRNLDENKEWLCQVYRWNSKKDLFRRLFSDCCMNACCFLMRKEFYSNVIKSYSLRPEFEWNQDLHFNFKAVMSSYDIYLMKEPTAIITIHNNQASKNGKCGLGNDVLLKEMHDEGRKMGWV